MGHNIRIVQGSKTVCPQTSPLMRMFWLNEHETRPVVTGSSSCLFGKKNPRTTFHKHYIYQTMIFFLNFRTINYHPENDD